MNHEDLTRDAEIEGASNRSFGLVFTVFFAIVGIWPLLSGRGVRTWSLAIAVAVLLVTVVSPRWFAIPNRLWTRFGMLMGKIVSPAATAVLFYGVITPFGIGMRIFRKDPLRLRFDANLPSYWIERTPPGPDARSMKNQF